MKRRPDKNSSRENEKRLGGHILFFILLILFLLAPIPNFDSQTSSLLKKTKPQNSAQTVSRKEPKKEKRATFLAVGDIMLSRGVDRAIERSRNPLLPFSGLDGLLRSTDFNFGNLESPVSGNNRRLGRGLVFNAHTDDFEGLVEYNFKIVNLANNHAFDQGLKGLRFTEKFLDKQKIAYLGTGENKSEAWQPKIIIANEIRIGFIGASYSSINDGGAVRNDYVARIEEIEHLKAAVKKLKTESDFIVVTMHAGVEYTRKPNQAQIFFAREAVKAGADLVIGGHAHWIQTFEQYRDKYIFYSLGNFIFDQPWQDTKEGLTLRITLLQREFKDSSAITQLERIELIPVVIEKCVPRLASEREAKKILGKIKATERVIIFPTAIKNNP